MKFPIRLLLVFAVIAALQPAQASQQILNPDAVSPVPLPHGAVARIGQGSLDQFEFSPDGKYFAVGGSIGIVVYDGKTFKPIWSAAMSAALGVSWSPQGQMLAAANRSEVLVWNGQTGTFLYRLAGYGGEHLQWTPDSSRLILNGDAIWTIGPKPPINLVRSDDGEYKDYGILYTEGLLSPDGHLVAATYNIGSPDASAEEAVVAVWDAKTGVQKRLLTFERFSFTGSVLWYPDSTHLIVWLNSGFTEWDITTGRQVNRPFAINKRLSKTHDEGGFDEFDLRGFGYSPQGDPVVWDYSRHDAMIDILTDTVIYKDPDGESDDVYSSDYKTVATFNAGDVVFRQFPGGTELRRTHDISSVAAFSPDLNTFVAWSEEPADTLIGWSAQNPQVRYPIAEKSSPLHDVAWSPDGSQIATLDQTGKVIIHDSYSYALEYTFENRSSDDSTLLPGRIVYSPDGKRIVAVASDQLRVRNVGTNLPDVDLGLSATFGGSNEWGGIAWSPDATHLALINQRQELIVIDLTTNQVQRSSDSIDDSSSFGSGYGVSWSPDGAKIATGSPDGSVAIRDAATLKVISTLTYSTAKKSANSTDAIQYLAYSPDGRSLAAIVNSSAHQYLVITDLQSGKVSASQIAADLRDITSLVWSRDGKKLAVSIGVSEFGLGWSSRDDGPIILFNAATGQQLTVLDGQSGDAEGVAFSPDGKQLASASLDGTVLIWDISNL